MLMLQAGYQTHIYMKRNIMNQLKRSILWKKELKVMMKLRI